MKALKVPRLRIAVGISGGVDSSVVAYLLKKAGHEVLGVHMSNWDGSDEAGVCTADIDKRDSRHVCEQLEIPFHEVEFKKEYWNKVFQKTLEGFAKGLTPNPDLLCNRFIKFDLFTNYALKELKVDYVATGHYARLQHSDDGPMLRTGVDVVKDQSYFLAFVPRMAFQHVLFPLGDALKTQVREIARTAKLAAASRPDSMGFCFVGKRDFSDFISDYIDMPPGPYLSVDGDELGKHKGMHRFTIGQSARLPGWESKWFVVSKDIKQNGIIIAPKSHPACYVDMIYANEFNWITPPKIQPGGSFRCRFQTRLREPYGFCTVTPVQEQNIPPPYYYFSSSYSRGHDPYSHAPVGFSAASSLASLSSLSGILDALNSIKGFKVDFDNPRRNIAPGQALVFYDLVEDIILGGGNIHSTGPSYHHLGKPSPEGHIIAHPK